MLRPLHLSVAIFEPDSSFRFPYKYLPKQYTIFRYTSFKEALDVAKTTGFVPDLIMISTNFPTAQLLDLLEGIIHNSDKKVPAIILTLDLSKKIIHIPGVSWGKKLGVLSTNCSELEVGATLARLFPITFSV